MTPGAWVQGMPDSDEASVEWTLVLYLRLTAQFDRLGEPRGNTKIAEEILGWAHHAYFFVGRPHPDYGASVTLFDHPDDGAADWKVAPFDTGGLVHGHIITDPELDQTARVELIDEWSRTDLSYVDEYETWLDDSFPSVAGYVRAQQPRAHLVPQIDPAKNSDHSWTWEGRLPAEPYADPPVLPRAVFLTTGRLNQFQKWVLESGVIPRASITAYMVRIAGLIQETASPVRAAQDTLC